MSSVGVIVNALSQRNKTELDDLIALLKNWPKTDLHILQGIDGLQDALVSLATGGCEFLVVAGGDGTVQAVVTELINGAMFEELPKLVLVPSGMTNVISEDCGLKGVPLEALSDFFLRQEAGFVETVSKPVLTMDLGHGEAPVHGFLLGAGLFYTAVSYSRANVQSRGAGQSSQVALTLIAFFLRSLLGRLKESEGHLPVTWCDDADREVRSPDLCLFLVSTLSKLNVRLSPFWGTEDGDLKFTTIDYPGRRLWRGLIPAARGKPKKWFEAQGYRSFNKRSVTMKIGGTLVFDGELFEPDPDVPVTLSAAHHIDFVA